MSTMSALCVVACSTSHVSIHTATVIQILARATKLRMRSFLGEDIGTLTAAVLSIECALHPLAWSGILIPALPPSLLDYVSAPVPFLIGVHTSLLPVCMFH
eukprot:SAG31_NODE_2885_length_4953_cov_4.633498_5_plen_101_part_00